MASSRRKATSFLGLILFAAPISAKFQNNFDLYPSKAQPCLYAASDASQCDGDTVAAMNKCLCSDDKGQFATNAAKCIGKEAKDTLRTVYSSMSTACSDSKNPIALTEDQFLNLGALGATASLSVTPLATSKSATPTTFMTTTTGGATVTVTNSPTSTPPADSDDAEGLSTKAKITIGVGSGLGAIAVACLAGYIWRIRRRREAHDELQRPMLGGGVGATGYNPHHGAFGEHSPPTSVAAFGAYNPRDYKNENSHPGWRPVSDMTRTPSPGAQTWTTSSPQPPYSQTQHAWGHHPQAAYAPPPPEPARGQQEGVFELASIPVSSPPQPLQPPPHVVEMPATEVQPAPDRFKYPSPR
ncbi:hypothetical protein CCHL11_00257 [Colletotrichum chlorophyti]|uniref:Extracellular membrane protein CFEM domain-containing protein n=1 Tax=Colletotrichum chlorophyti TaxID=708187 RepID=A0A1Q8RUC3_9PEZI|nr:hypothetical protein CCHL11_00257 [Colletotrichum chlorophyti]